MSIRQPCLPGFDGSEREDAPGADLLPLGDSVEPQTGEVPVLPGQIGLFTVERELLGVIDAAIVDGCFEDARDVRNELVAREGASRETRRLQILDALGAAGFWTRPLEQCVDGWAEIERRWDVAEPGVRAMVRDGVLRRLVRDHQAWALVRARPSLLPAIVNVLGKRAAAGSGGEPGDDGGLEAAAAATLLRDALAAGIGAPSGDFDDAAFVDLLAEDRAPQWLACVGALRRLWPVPAAEAGGAGEALPPPEDDEERGEQFWRCLQIAASAPRESLAAGEARKRMKVLDPTLHAQFMRQGVRRE